MNYWEECIMEAFDDAKLIATKEQIDTVVECIEGAFDNYGMAFGHDCIPNPLDTENKILKNELKKEKDKVHCKKCNGEGYITENFGFRSSTSTCPKCRGEGRHTL